MKIAIINYSDISGGAAKAAYRLQTGLIEAGVMSRMFVLNKTSNDDNVIAPNNSFLVSKTRSKLDQLPLVKYFNKNSTLFSVNWLPFSPIVPMVNKFNPDVVHMHWIGFSTIRIKDLVKFESPIVWSMHDNYPFTGGCHLIFNCERYKQICGCCPNLGSYDELDISRKLFLDKQETIKQLKNMVFVGLSRWITNCAKESSLLCNNLAINIPNPIDTRVFYPDESDLSKKELGLPLNKKLLLFGAIRAKEDQNKGYARLSDALQLINKENVELIIFGSNQPTSIEQHNIKTHYFGRLSSDETIRKLYCAADVCIVPSFQENLSNVIMESLACGTPVVAFNIGGNSDMIEHLNNGYLAEPYNHIDLARGINWIVRHESPLLLKENARQTIINRFDSKIVIKQYIKLYKQVACQSK